MTSYIYDMVDTWNAGATTFTAVKMNVTDTASASGSLLMDLQVGGSSKFSVSKGSALTIGSSGINGDLSLITLGSNVFVRKRVAANLQLGAADAAAPVPQTLGVQSVVAGTTNTAGADWTFDGSQGTGTGAGGSLIFRVAPAGSSGTAQNALATALTIASDRSTTFAGSMTINASGFISGAIIATINNLAAQNGVGIKLSADTFARISLGLDSGTPFFGMGAGSGARDTFLLRDAANTLALRNSTTAQAFRVYNTFTDTTTFERANIFWDSNVLKIGTEKGSVGGTARALELQTDGTTALTIDTSQRVTVVSGSYPPFTAARVGNFSGFTAAFAVSARTTQNALDGFGPSFDFLISDDTATNENLGGLAYVRAGADNIGAFVVRVNNGTNTNERFRITSAGTLVLVDSANITFNTGTGTKIGTATSEKLAFWNATPIVQPTTGVAEAAFVENSGGTAVNVDSTFDGYTIQQVVKALRNAGLLA